MNQSVKSHCCFSNNVRSGWNIFPETSGCSDPYECKRYWFRFRFAGNKIDVYKGIQFINKNVDIVGAYA